MSKVKNVSGTDLVVPSLGGRLVAAGQVVEVADEAVYGFTQQVTWDAADPAAKKAHKQAHDAYLERAGLSPAEPEAADNDDDGSKR